MPIPPLAEQRRIVAKIEELMPLVEEYRKAEERLTALNAEFPDKLRKSILQQAIQGKLTERAPADEPASELLKRIRAEKERLPMGGILFLFVIYAAFFLPSSIFSTRNTTTRIATPMRSVTVPG